MSFHFPSFILISLGPMGVLPFFLLILYFSGFILFLYFQVHILNKAIITVSLATVGLRSFFLLSFFLHFRFLPPPHQHFEVYTRNRATVFHLALASLLAFIKNADSMPPPNMGIVNSSAVQCNRGSENVGRLLRTVCPLIWIFHHPAGSAASLSIQYVSCFNALGSRIYEMVSPERAQSLIRNTLLPAAFLHCSALSVPNRLPWPQFSCSSGKSLVESTAKTC